MKISSRGRYGLRLMIELAARYGSGPTLVDLLAKKEEISANYIHVLMGSLKSAGLVRSVRGPNGGYALSRPPSTITAFDVISVMEGKTIAADCVVNPDFCARAKHCPTRPLWCEVADGIVSSLKGVTLAKLAEKNTPIDMQTAYSI